MSQIEVAENNVAADPERASAYVPPLQRTEGQPPPIAAHGGLSYMAFDRDGDAGTAEALKDALAEIAEGEGQRVIDMIAKAPSGPIKTKWGVAFRDYDDCVTYIRQSNSLKAPPGGVALVVRSGFPRVRTSASQIGFAGTRMPTVRRRSRRSRGTSRVASRTIVYGPGRIRRISR